jgi:hypothetical protein
MGDASHRIDIGGNARGPVVAGDYNVVVDAQHGSAVTLLLEREKPLPVRRERVALLPRQQPELLGRDAESVALAEAIRAGGPVQLCGPPGVGKSTLLRHAAHTVPPGPDGVVYLSGAHREVGDLAQEIFEACYDAVGYAPSNTELRRLMSGVRVTVYVDNADLTMEQVRELTDSAPDATFVFASVDQSLLGDGTVLELEGLDHEAGLRLLSRELRRPLAESELGTAADLWQAAGGRPLFLLRAAGLARSNRPGAAVLPPPGAIAGLLPLLLGHLDDAAMSVLHLLATLDDIELDPVHIGALTGVSQPAELCEHLTGLGLTVTSERGTRCAPDAVPVVRQRNPHPFPAEALCGYFLHWANQPATTPAQVAAYGPALEKVSELAEWAGRPDLVVRIARATSPTLARSLRFGAWGRLLGRGWNAAQQTGDQPAAAYFMHEEGIRSLLTGRRVLAMALLAEVVVLWNQLGDIHGATAALHAQHYAPAAAHAVVSPAAQSGTAAAGNGATATQASTATNGTAASHTAAGHSATTGHTAAGHSATAGHGAAGHSATAGHATAAHSSASSHTATSHMTQLGHHSAGHAATAHHAGGHAVHHVAAGHAHHGAAAAHGHHGVGHAAAAHGHHGHLAATHGHHVAGHAAAHAQHGAGHATAAHLHHAGHLVHVAGHGSTHVGTAAVAAKGISATTMVLIGAAVVGATVIGGVAITSKGDVPPPTGIVGTWSNGGSTLTISADGPGSYTLDSSVPGCGAFSVHLTGDDNSANGEVEGFNEDGSCSRDVRIDVTVTGSPDGNTASFETKLAPGQPQAYCHCGTFTLTRDR